MPTERRRAGIAGLAVEVPEQILTNADLERMVDTSDEWIRTRTGIEQRRVAGPDTAASDLAAAAARKALVQAGVAPEEVDLILVATVTGDMPFPSTACFVQAKLGCHRAAAMDLQAACPGWLYALVTGEQFIASGVYDTVLVIGVEVLTKVTDFTDRSTAVLFGDGAGAAVLQPARPDRGLLSAVLGADGTAAELLMLPAGGSRSPASAETVANRQHFIKMNGPEVFKIAVRAMGDAAVQVLEKAGLSQDDIDLVVPHQANLRIIDATVKRLGVPPERVVVNIDRYGNTSAASIPIALSEAIAEGRVNDGDTLLLVSFGAGMAWAAVALRWGL